MLYQPCTYIIIHVNSIEWPIRHIGTYGWTALITCYTYQQIISVIISGTEVHVHANVNFMYHG